MTLQQKQYGKVHFTSSPNGAIIIVDGQYATDPDTEEYKRTPTTITLLEGRRDFILRLDGHDDTIGYVDILPNTTVNIHRNFKTGSPGGGEKPEPQINLYLRLEDIQNRSLDELVYLYEKGYRL